MEGTFSDLADHRYVLFFQAIAFTISSACLLYYNFRYAYSGTRKRTRSESSSGMLYTYKDGHLLEHIEKLFRYRLDTLEKDMNVANTPALDKSVNNVKPTTSQRHVNQNTEQESVNTGKLSLVEKNMQTCGKMKFLVFVCLKNQMCGGWGDRQKGIISTYLLSLLTNRTFGIVSTNPCNLSQFLVPNEYNWNLCDQYIRSVPTSDSKTVSAMGGNAFKNSIRDMNLASPFDQHVVFIQTNQIWNEYILAHPNAAQRLPWAIGKSIPEVSALVLKRLFKPSTLLKTEIRRFTGNVTKSRQMICSHIRVGKNPTIPKDGVRHFGIPNVTAIFKFLSKFDIPSKYIIYVATDSEEVRRGAKGNFTTAVTVDMPIIHIDRYSKTQESLACQGFFTVLLEQYILSECDLLLLTRSNLGSMAAYMSMKEQDIFIFHHTKHTIYKINRTEIQDYYRYI